MTSQLDALRASTERLRQIVHSLDDTQLEAQAYPTEWRIADVLSHLGSGAVIMSRRIMDGRAGRQVPDDFAPSVWDTWNAKSPRQKAVDALAVDHDLVEDFAGVPDTERSTFSTSFGPLTVGFDELVGFRLNEHTLHTWDVEVALEPAATLHSEQTAFVIDHLALIARFTAKPTGALRTVAVRTTDPARDFAIEFAADAVTVRPEPVAGQSQLVLPAEAFVRLVYGRLDPHHTPAVDGDAENLDQLRKAFPGP